MQNVGRCNHCGYENLTRHFRAGVCRAIVSCRARAKAQQSPTVTRYLALPHDVAMLVATELDRQRLAMLAWSEREEGDLTPMPAFRTWDEIMDSIEGAR